MDHPERLERYGSMGVRDATKLANKIEKADIPILDKLRIYGLLTAVGEMTKNLSCWESTKFSVEILADLTKNMLNIMGKLDDEIPDDK